MKKDKVFPIRVDSDEKELFDKAAEKMGVRPSVWGRIVLKREADVSVNGVVPVTEAEPIAPLTKPAEDKEKPSADLSHSEVAKTTSDNLPAFDNNGEGDGTVYDVLNYDKDGNVEPPVVFKDKPKDTVLLTESPDNLAKPVEKKPLSPALQKLLDNNPKLQMLNKEGIVEEPEGEPEYEYAPEDHEVVATLHKGQPVDIAEKAFARGGAIVYFKLSGLVYKAEFKPQTSVCVAYSNGDWCLVSSTNWGVRKGSITVTKK